MKSSREKSLKLFIVSLLAFVGGYINVVSLLSKFKYSISHLTGNISKVAEGYMNGNKVEVLALIFIVVAFFLGAITSGIVVGSGEFKFRKKYGIVLMLQGVMLYCAMVLLKKSYFEGLLLASYVCGIQNGLIIRFDGALVRTTHLTGTITDLGVSIGAFLKSKKVEKWRFILNLVLILSFFFGGVIGVTLFRIYQVDSLYLAILIYMSLGVFYYFSRRMQLKIKK